MLLQMQHFVSSQAPQRLARLPRQLALRNARQCTTFTPCQRTQPTVELGGLENAWLPLRSSGTSTATLAPTTTAFNIEEEVEFLKEDLQHLFDDQGIDAAKYDDRVEFRDPISKYSNVQGYLFNIAFLKTVFDPLFQLHDIRVTGPSEITTRWTMTMKFTPAANSPLSKFWSPQLVFTGTSIYGFNPANGKINRHVDTWDSIYNQDYFSVEAFTDFLRQMVHLSVTPKLETPDYTILRRQKSGSLIYEIRRYEPFICAETGMDEAGQSRADVNPAGPGNRAFNALAGYIFGRNQQGVKMRMTTPVFTSNNGTMSFVIGPSAMQGNRSLPSPVTDAVKVTREPGGVYAVLAFNGRATPEIVNQQEWLLREAVVKDGMVAGLDWKLARYNDPSTPDFLRRNEVLIPVDGFDLWQMAGFNGVSDSMQYVE